MTSILKKKLNKKGFTLAELLIVVAIIAVLVAVAVPVFSANLVKAKQATDDANIRTANVEYSAYDLNAAAAGTGAEGMIGGFSTEPNITGTTITFGDGTTYTFQYYTGVSGTGGKWVGTHS